MKDGDQKDRRGKLYTEENLFREENLKLNIIKGKYCLHETFKKKVKVSVALSRLTLRSHGL